MPTSNGLLTVPEVAARLGLNTDQVYRRIHSGHLRARRVLGWKTRYLVEPDAIRAYLDAGGQVNVDILPMLRASQVAEITGFTPETVRQLCEDGHLEFVRGPGRGGRPGHYRISRASVERYLNAQHARWD